MFIKVWKTDDLQKALRLLNEHSDICIIAGGTDVIPRKHRGLVKSEKYLCVGDIKELRLFKQIDDTEVFIGAGLKLIEILEEKKLNSYHSLLQATRKVASNQIRNQATLGGNILQETRCMYYNSSISWRRKLDACYKMGGNKCFQYRKSPECVALFQSDLAPVFLSYGAVAILASLNAEREIPFEKLYHKSGKKDIMPNELLLGIKIPLFNNTHRSAYIKEALRGTFDFPIVSCAVSMFVEKSIIKSSNIVLGSTPSYPFIIKELNKKFIGKNIDDCNKDIFIKDIKTISKKYIMPFKDTRTDGNTRLLMAENVIARAIHCLGRMSNNQEIKSSY